MSGQLNQLRRIATYISMAHIEEAATKIIEDAGCQHLSREAVDRIRYLAWACSS